jgi:NAD(P)-dependent dehydrogenase (short-subunit alcohol dehydrogenase family)
MTIADKTVLVTGANRGIGQALVADALRRGARRVYAGTRQPLAHPDGRVTPLTLDVTNPAQIQAAAEQVDALDLLINNAGIWLYDDLSDRAMLEEHLAVNFYGTWGVTQAFLPLLTRSKGTIVNNVSLMALAALPLTPAYSASKAAAFSLTQSLRALLGGGGAGACRADRPGRHRHDPKPRHPQGLPGIGRTDHPRRRGERGGGHLPRSHVGLAG